MGMFDNVNFKSFCLYCGAELNGAQSKDYLCSGTLVEPVMVNSFYDECRECKTWHDYSVAIDEFNSELKHIRAIIYITVKVKKDKVICCDNPEIKILPSNYSYHPDLQTIMCENCNVILYPKIGGQNGKV